MESDDVKSYLELVMFSQGINRKLTNHEDLNQSHWYRRFHHFKRNNQQEMDIKSNYHSTHPGHQILHFPFD